MKIFNISLEKKNILNFLLIIWIFFYHSHFIIRELFPFYRECLSFIFLILIFIYTKKKYYNIFFSIINIIKNKEVFLFFFCYFFFFLIIIFNSGTIDPEYIKSSKILKGDVSNNILILYVLRNFSLFLPIIIFIYQTGLNEIEIKRLLNLFFFIGSFFYFLNLFKLIAEKKITFYYLINKYHIYSDYNTYVPMLSGLFSIGVYLLLNEKNTFLKSTYIFLSSILALMIIIASGKSSIIFIILSIIFFTLINYRDKKNLFALFIMVFLILLFYQFIKFFYLIFDGSILRTPIMELKNERFKIDGRLALYQSFFEYAEIAKNDNKKFFFGTGSLSSIFSGFHNDYFRIFYRTGLCGLLFSFIPIFYIFLRLLFFTCHQFILKDDKNVVYILFLLSTFIPYYSFFGYPREDVFQSGIFWFSNFLIFGYFSKKKKL